MGRRPKESNNPWGLSERETEVLELFHDVGHAKGVAARLGVSSRTVESHLANIRAKMSVETTVAAVARYAKESARVTIEDAEFDRETTQNELVRQRRRFALPAFVALGAIGALAIAGAIYSKPRLIADSVADFGSVQGYRNWYYGYFSEPDLPGEFKLMTEYGTQGWMAHRDDYFTRLWKDGAHPNGRKTTGDAKQVEHWPVRRWVSPITATLTIQVEFRKDNFSAASNGVGLIVYHRGNEVWRYKISGFDGVGVSHSMRLKVKPGDEIDFALDPLFSDDGADDTITVFRILR